MAQKPFSPANGYIITDVGIPPVCPGCGMAPMEVTVAEYDPTRQTGKVVCKECSTFIRPFRAVG